jgi:hypothetical protein
MPVLEEESWVLLKITWHLILQLYCPPSQSDSALPPLMLFQCFILIVQKYGVLSFPVPQGLQPNFFSGVTVSVKRKVQHTDSWTMHMGD